MRTPARHSPPRALRLAAALLLAACLLGRAADRLEWRTDESRVDAEISSWTLGHLLERVAEATGWNVLVEPGLTRSVSVKFKGLPEGEALRRLLGDLNFALLPRAGEPPRLLIFRNSPQDATQALPVKAKAAGKRIANELVITLKPGVEIDDLARRLGATIVGRLDKLRLYRLRFADEAAALAAKEQLSRMNDIASVDSNFVADRPPAAEPLAASSIRAPSLPTPNAKAGPGLVIGLVDTSVQPLGAGLDAFLLPPVSMHEQQQAGGAGLLHGTSMASTILRGLELSGYSSESSPVHILPVNVYASDGSATTFDVAQGIYLAIQGGANVVNLSLGGSGDSAYLHTLIKYGTSQGVLFVAAAGNQPVTAPTFPAAYPEVIATTAGDRSGNIASYANRGEFVDVVAPGASIVYFGGKAYMVQGTSAASAYVAGMAAGLAAKSGKPLAEVEATLRATLAAPAP